MSTMSITYEQVEKALISFVQLSNGADCLCDTQEVLLNCEFDIHAGTFNKTVLIGALPAFLKGCMISEMKIVAFSHLDYNQADIDEFYDVEFDGYPEEELVDTMCYFMAQESGGDQRMVTAAIRVSVADEQLRLLANTIVKH